MKKYFQFKYKNTWKRIYIGDIVELRDDYASFLRIGEYHLKDNMTKLIGKTFKVERFHNGKSGNTELILDDLKFKDKYGYSNKIMLPASYFIPSLKGMRKLKLEKLLKNGNI